MVSAQVLEWRATSARRAAVRAAVPATFTARLDAAGAPIMVIDVAWDQPTVAQIKATGAAGVLRYFSTDPSKNLTSAHVTAYLAAGLMIGSVWETTAGRATAGRAAGIADAKAADAMRASVGLPNTHVIHFAVDSDLPWSSVSAYFAGVVSVLGVARTGCYGGYRVIEGAAAAGIRFLWQTLAWSYGKLSAHATLYQSGGTVLSGAADINHVLAADWGQYPRPAPEDIVTPQDIAAVAAAVWNHTEPNAVDGSATRMGAVMRYTDKKQNDLMAAIKGVDTDVEGVSVALAADAAAISTAVAAIAGPDVTDAQVAALATALGPQLGPAVAEALAARLAN